MKNPLRLLNLMKIAIMAINGIKKIGEEEFKFFLKLANLQPTTIAISAPTKPVVVVSAVVEQALALPVKPPAPKPGTILSALPALTPGKPLPVDRPERIMKTPAPVVSDFAAKINGAAVVLGKEDKSLLGRFRKVLADQVSRGIEYWSLCCEVTEDALRGADLTESDWDLLVAKMKRRLFFTGKNGALFIEQCPKEMLSRLLLDQDGLTVLVAKIRTEEYENKSSIYNLAFILDAGKKVGDEAKILVENAKYAVNRMKQRGFIPADHWLVGKVRDFNRSKLPERKYVSLENIAVPAEVLAEAPALAQLESVEPPVEAIVVESAEPAELSDEELEKLTAPDKPTQLDPAFEAAFEQQMLNAAGESATLQ